jgi:hypothetical protein
MEMMNRLDSDRQLLTWAEGRGTPARFDKLSTKGEKDGAQRAARMRRLNKWR